MFCRIKDTLRRARFSYACRGTLLTKPMALTSTTDLALMAQLQHKDVRMALVAFKSFAMRMPVGAVYILSDGSLTPDDFDLLRRHIPSATFLKLEDQQSRHCPTGGTWERLLSICQSPTS